MSFGDFLKFLDDFLKSVRHVGCALILVLPFFLIVGSCDKREPAPVASRPYSDHESVTGVAPWETILVNDVIYYRGFRRSQRDTVQPDMKFSIPFIEHEGEIVLDHFLWLNEKLYSIFQMEAADTLRFSE